MGRLRTLLESTKGTMTKNCMTDGVADLDHIAAWRSALERC